VLACDTAALDERPFASRRSAALDAATAVELA
jgi:hypothetical protein